MRCARRSRPSRHSGRHFDSGEGLHIFKGITGPPNEFVAPIHNRMPVILPPAAWRRWLSEDEADADELLGLLRPYPAGLMRAYPVATRVGSIRNNDPDLLRELAA